MSFAADSLVIPVLFFAVLIAVGFVYVSYTSMAAGSTSGIFSNSAQVTQSLGVVIGMTPFVLVGMTLAAIVSSMLVRANPIFFGIAIIIIVMQFFVTAYLSNSWESILSSSVSLQSAMALAPYVGFIMTYLPLVTFLLSVLVVVVTYMRG